MKAKEYAEMYKTTPTIETLGKIMGEFIRNTGDLTVGRRCQTADACYAVIDEQDNKWRAFARLVPGVKPGGYLSMMKKELPEDAWMFYYVHRRKVGKPLDFEEVKKEGKNVEAQDPMLDRMA
jgi:hypothetical protein